MNKNFRSIIFSTIIIIVGMGVMASFRQTPTARTAGGAVFIIGCIVMALSIHNILRNGAKH